MTANESLSENGQLLEELFRSRSIDIQRGPLFDRLPALPAQEVDFDRVEGMLLGAAIGDALGNTTESQHPSQRLAWYGEIRDYLPNRHANGQRVGLPSDDTQLTFWTLEQILADRRFVPERVAQRFCRQRIFGIGSAVWEFVANMKAGKPWYRAGPKSAGNGALMRISPVLLPYVNTGTEALWADAALSAMITHNDSASISACVAFTGMLWRLLRMGHAPAPEWWPNSYTEIARALEHDETYRSNAPAYADYQGPLWHFAGEVVSRAYEDRLSTLDACNTWYSGPYLFETVPSVLYILMRFGHDPEEAIVRAVNDTWDNDTVGAIVGAAVGALHGRSGLPGRWLKGLLGRTADADDGQVFRLLEQAREISWS